MHLRVTDREGNQAAEFMSKGDREEGFWEGSDSGLESFIVNNLNCVGF